MIPDQVLPVITAGLGALVSMAVAYVAIGRDISFIKGQMSGILNAVHAMEKVREEHLIIKEHVRRLRKDVNAVHVQLRQDVEDPMDEPNGSEHEE